nr:hypothetical protein [Tanacetum cinerariifolium]
MEYKMKNVFGLRWNCRELKGIVKLRFLGSETALPIHEVDVIISFLSSRKDLHVNEEVVSKEIETRLMLSVGSCWRAE